MLRVVLGVLVAVETLTQKQAEAIYKRLKDNETPLTLDETIKEIRQAVADSRGANNAD